MKRAYLSFSSSPLLQFIHSHHHQYRLRNHGFLKGNDSEKIILIGRNFSNFSELNHHAQQQREFHTCNNLRSTSQEDVFEIMKQKGVHGRRPFTNLFSGSETSKVISETKVTITEEDARRMVEKMATVDHSIDHFRKQVEECAGLHDRTERVNSILWEMKKQGKQPDFAMKLLINDVLEGKQPRKRYDEAIFTATDASESSKETENNEEKGSITFTVQTERIEKFTGVKPGESHGHKSHGPPPVQTEKNFKDKDFFEPIKAALSKTRRETEESIRSIFKGKFSKKDQP